jgi:hypothetical protein
MPVQEGGGNEGDLPPVAEPGSKGGRPGPPPPGGGPGPGPGGFGSFGGGVNPSVFRLLGGLGENIPIMLRKRGLGGIPGVTPGPPGRSDTVPAFLTPGEPVASNPTGDMSLRDAILMLNQMQSGGGMNSGGGFEHGGMAGACPHCGAMHEAQGYAFGGMAPGGFASNFLNNTGIGRGLQAKLQAKPPGEGQAGGPGGAWTGTYGYNPQGGVTNYNPNDPWGAFNQNRDPTPWGQAFRQTGAFGGAGYFDPRGNQMLLNSMNEGAQGTADALVRRSVAGADLGGLDPAQRAVAKLQAQREAGRGVQDIMANTRAQALGNQNDFAQRLYEMMVQGNLGQVGAIQGAQLQDWLAGKQANREHKNQWGNMAGGILGSAAGGYFGGMGKGQMGRSQPAGGQPDYMPYTWPGGGH